MESLGMAGLNMFEHYRWTRLWSWLSCSSWSSWSYGPTSVWSGHMSVSHRVPDSSELHWFLVLRCHGVNGSQMWLGRPVHLVTCQSIAVWFWKIPECSIRSICSMQMLHACPSPSPYGITCLWSLCFVDWKSVWTLEPFFAWDVRGKWHLSFNSFLLDTCDICDKWHHVHNVTCDVTHHTARPPLSPSVPKGFLVSADVIYFPLFIHRS